MRARVLVVDDEPAVRDIASRCLADRHDVTAVADGAAALDRLAGEVFDVLVCDLLLREESGIDVVRRALETRRGLAVVVVSGRGTVERFAELLRLGVTDYVLKPFEADALRLAVERALALRLLRLENARLRERLRPRDEIAELLGEGPAMCRVKELVTRVARTDSTVLITGESGTGKGLAARALHRLSGRADSPFVTVHCGALAETLLESELFGHARGAFTGAEVARRGCFEEAEGGTLFLDEVGTMSPALQVRLLRVLSTREVTRLGEDRSRPVHARVIAATNASLPAEVRAGTFREDLLFRLGVFLIEMPPLRVRGRADVEVLAERFVADACARLGRSPKTLGAAARRALHAHAWPGNVRELANVLERAVILSGETKSVEPEHVLLTEVALPSRPTLALPPEGVRLRELLDGVARDLIDQALERTGGNKGAAARLLGLKRTALVERLKRSAERSRGPGPVDGASAARGDP